MALFEENKCFKFRNLQTSNHSAAVTVQQQSSGNEFWARHYGSIEARHIRLGQAESLGRI